MTNYKPYIGQPVKIVTLILNWPTLGATPSNPKLALKTTTGHIVARAHEGSRAASEAILTQYANDNYLALQA